MPRQQQQYTKFLVHYGAIVLVIGVLVSSIYVNVTILSADGRGLFSNLPSTSAVITTGNDDASTPQRIASMLSIVMIAIAFLYSIYMWSSRSRWRRADIGKIGYMVTSALTILAIGMLVGGDLQDGGILLGVSAFVFIIFVTVTYLLREYEQRVRPNIEFANQLREKHGGSIDGWIAYADYYNEVLIPELQEISGRLDEGVKVGPIRLLKAKTPEQQRDQARTFIRWAEKKGKKISPDHPLYKKAFGLDII